MSQYTKIPFANPFKFTEYGHAPSPHFDDTLWMEQRKPWERDVRYTQKWPKAKTTPLQIESSVAPSNLQLFTDYGLVVKSFEWVEKYAGTGYKVYETIYDVSDMVDDVYFLHQRANILDYDARFISEPIRVGSSFPNLLEFSYSNSYNDNDVMFKTGVKFKFFCEAAIMDMLPDRDRTDYIKQTRDVVTLKGTPSRKFKLWIADAIGVAPWVIDLQNRIWCCDTVYINGKRYETEPGSKWEVQRIKGYPLVGATIDLVPAFNLHSLEHATTEPLAPGFVTAYDIETSFFGPGAIVPIIEVETNE